MSIFISRVPGWLSRYSESLRDRRFGDRFPVRVSFPHPFRPALGLTQPSMQWMPCLSWSIVAETWRCPPTTSSTDVKESVELYLYSPHGHRGLFYGEI